MAQVHGKIEEKDHGFLRKLCFFIRGCQGQLPNLRDIFRPEAIEWLLTESIKSKRMDPDPLVHFVINSGYKDEPVIGEGGKPSSRRTTPIHHAFDVNYTDEDGLTHLHAACKSGCTDAVKKFLEVSQDPNCIVPKTGDSPLHLAARNGSKEVTLLLLRNGANPNLANEKGLTPLHIICEHPFITEEILKNLAVEEGFTPLQFTCKKTSRNDLPELFLKINDELNQLVKVDARDNKGRTPLHLALERENNDVVKYVLKRGADPNLTDEEGFTPLHVTCKKTSRNDLPELFLKINDELNQLVKVDARDNEGRTPLQWAVSNFTPDVIDVLLDHGADLSNFVFPSSFESTYRTPMLLSNALQLKLSLVSGLLACVERLEKRGYELTRNDVLKIVEFFIEHKLFGKSTDLDDNWFDDEEFAEEAKQNMITSSLSFYDLIQLQPEEVTKLLTPEDFYNLTETEELWWYLPEEGPTTEACARCMCEKISRRFFRRWALYPLLELTKYQLPILCCNMIIERLMNEDLSNICLAAAGRSSC
ncbi:unnamed protein product [Trichogramma brassicae]|uniref:Uncharacterized protein n=1 Tax=Trichogramma brassicae TaxID=86971 RepID=A0A6H5IYG2_9HYME|nr:unnamed protein product [Trichogramma brassicae]